MAEDDDDDSKTEDPTEKKLRDALEKGNVPTSREAPPETTCHLCGGILVSAKTRSTGAPSFTQTSTQSLMRCLPSALRLSRCWWARFSVVELGTRTPP